MTPESPPSIDRTAIPASAAADILGLPDSPSIALRVVIGVVISGAAAVFTAFVVDPDTSAGRLLGILGVAVVLAGVGLGVGISIRDGQRDRRRRRMVLEQLIEHGVAITAEVTGIIPSTEPALVFEYAVGAGYWRRLDSRDLPANAPRVGDRIPILVDPDEPGVCLWVA